MKKNWNQPQNGERMISKTMMRTDLAGCRNDLEREIRNDAAKTMCSTQSESAETTTRTQNFKSEDSIMRVQQESHEDRPSKDEEEDESSSTSRHASWDMIERGSNNRPQENHRKTERNKESNKEDSPESEKTERNTNLPAIGKHESQVRSDHRVPLGYEAVDRKDSLTVQEGT